MAKSSKGGELERVISRYLTKWISGSEKPVIFWRTPSSGAMLTLHGDENMSGDIIAVRPDGEWLVSYYSIECKNGYPQTSLDKFLKTNKSDPLKAFWEQCVRDAIDSNKQPMLIYKKKGMSNIWIGLADITKYKDDMEDFRCISMTWSKSDKLPNLHMYNMKDFFDTITPEIMKERIGCS